MYRARLTSDTYQSVRTTLTSGYRQVQVEGVSDNVAIGFVREYGQGPGPLPAGYIVFQGKQSKPSHHYSAKDITQAEQRVNEALHAAQWAATRRAEERRKSKRPKADYTEHTDRHVLVRSYSLTATARLIREALKAAFPAIKFSVTTDRFSGGTSLDIRYTDGPSSKQVQAVYAPFITGHFDGMQDMHVFSAMPTTVTGDGELVRLSFGAKYISDHRAYSPAYGSCLSSLDLREIPSLRDQLSAFLSWHTAREYNLKTCYTEQASAIALSSNSRSGDLEKLAVMLTVQGHAASLTRAGDVQTLTVTVAAGNVASALPESGTLADMMATGQDIAAEYEAAERQWLDQDTTAEYEAVERRWLNDSGEWAAPALLRLQN